MPHIERLDPNKTLCDCLYFDGASNVQKGGRIIEAKYPRVSVMHGVEHVVSLFFSDVAKIPIVQNLIQQQKRRYNTFGSGAIHGAHAIFSVQAKLFNGGKDLGLLRAADTRMAGYFMAMHRDLRQKKALESTVTSAAFRDLQLKPFAQKAADEVGDKDMWKRMYWLLRVLFPALRILRLADSNSPGMDKVYYYSRKTLAAIENSVDVLDDKNCFPEVVLPDVVDDGGVEDDGDQGFSSCDDDIDTAGDGVGTNNPDDDDSSSDTDTEGGETTSQENAVVTFSGQILQAWKKREKAVLSDFAIAGWLLSVCPEVRQDVVENECGTHRLAMDRVLTKLYANDTDEDRYQKIDTFWSEYSLFKNKLSPYNRPHIWNSHDIHNSSHLWHEKYSLPFTKVLGATACRVTSKILGIGACERAWGDVKHLKTGETCPTTTLPITLVHYSNPLLSSLQVKDLI